MKEKKAVGFGMMNQGIENAEELAEELIERGQLKRKDSRGFIKTILERAQTEQTEFHKVVREIVKDIFETLGVATKSDLDAMLDRLDNVEQKMKPAKSTSKPADVKATGKKTASKKKPAPGKKHAPKKKPAKAAAKSPKK